VHNVYIGAVQYVCMLKTSGINCLACKKSRLSWIAVDEHWGIGKLFCKKCNMYFRLEVE